MGLTILCAGCSSDERTLAESEIRQALEKRARADPWTVSAVKGREYWSVTLDGPGLSAVTLKAPTGRLAEVIEAALAGPSQAASLGSNAFASATAHTKTARHDCAHCRRSFAVTYDESPNEPEVDAPVACPHCWKINQVTIAESAAVTLDYRTEIV
ncbi:MAG TPA: hypothetical protein VFM88_18100 [Vicinamibacteria bacterium]|nr:hypothetical protein [Vicinamibacteria bacterium]